MTTRRRVLQSIAAGAASAVLTPSPARAVDNAALPTRSKRLLRPVLDGDWWLVGARPQLGALKGQLNELPPGPDIDQFAKDFGLSEAERRQVEEMAESMQDYARNTDEVVAHHAFQAADGIWHLWAGIRRTAAGKIIYHWSSDDFFRSPWTDTGQIMRCDRGAGECMSPLDNGEGIHALCFVQHADTWYMFYTTDGIGEDRFGQPISATGGGFKAMTDEVWQIGLMTSTDGRTWNRYRNDAGHSRVFTGPGNARDPYVLNIGGTWYLYYAAFEAHPLRGGGIYVRTSSDLLHWSDYRLVHRDATRGGPLTWSHETPLVVYRDGYYYLFRTENYYTPVSHVYRSEDPLDFGIDDGGEKYVTSLACACPKTYVIGAAEYVSSNHNTTRGVEMCGLQWETV